MKQASESYLYSSLLSVKNFLLCISPYCCFVIRIIKAKRRVNTADNQVLCILGVDLSECSLANSLMFLCLYVFVFLCAIFRQAGPVQLKAV